MLFRYPLQKRFYNRKNSGFTLLETLIVIAVLGLIGAISVPSWLTFLEGWKLSDAQANIFFAIRNTQTYAQTNQLTWQLSIRETPTGDVQWASHAQKDLPTVWQSLGSDTIDIDLADTTLDSRNGAYYIRFNYKGHLSSRTRTLTLTSSEAPTLKRCVVMSTLLGAVRKAQEQQRASSSGRYCY
ncbi:type II secretion system protein [Leptothoe spongobia]|uniref:Type II secretion system protein n=1 Tax=Leptothoe spongobia TAU-MAC 1115 TaxID=1967444 RepID=A0A947GJD7_9CYAN|nr:type II secretion system protein [Leptothoe spongobia]MBT9315567.1 type II secretion system protein [Leptothoe spongobia TAU-MAC 1115]